MTQMTHTTDIAKSDILLTNIIVTVAAAAITSTTTTTTTIRKSHIPKDNSQSMVFSQYGFYHRRQVSYTTDKA